MAAKDAELLYFLSSVTTGLCIIRSLPQIKTVIRNKSVRGISQTSLMLEFWSYLTTVSYSMHFDYPLAMFSEYPPLLLQDVILFFLIVLYDEAPHHALILFFVPISISLHSAIALRMVPSWVPVLALSISAPIGNISKLIQLYAIIRAKDAGQVSALTWFLNFISGLSRLSSFAVSIVDKTLAISLACSTVLNLSVVIAAIIYRKVDADPVLKPILTQTNDETAKLIPSKRSRAKLD